MRMNERIRLKFLQNSIDVDKEVSKIILVHLKEKVALSFVLFLESIII